MCSINPRQRTRAHAAAMNPAPGLALYQSSCLQRLLHPRIAQTDLVFFAELLMEVPHVQIEVLVPVQDLQNLFGPLLLATCLLLGFCRRSSKPW